MIIKGPEAIWKFLIDRKMISEFPLFGATYTILWVYYGGRHKNFKVLMLRSPDIKNTKLT